MNRKQNKKSVRKNMADEIGRETEGMEGRERKEEMEVDERHSRSIRIRSRIGREDCVRDEDI